MIYEIDGDITLTGAEAIAHGVSPNDHFEAGLALALRELWPAMAKDYRHYAHQAHPKPGELWTYRNAEGRTIYNLITQEGDHSSSTSGRATTGNVNHALRRLRHELATNGTKSLALPKLATGAGGLDWTVVRPLIDQQLGDLNIPIYLYTTFHKGKQGSEPKH
ncbi:MAG: Appr-1-p processing protein [Gemmatimonadaceae bacterium]|nr:Appr-1-p processing protein [Gemmatimonadaceae bacterium]